MPFILCSGSGFAPVLRWPEGAAVLGNVCVGNPYFHSDGHVRVQSEFFHQRSFKLMEVTLAKVKVLMEGREWAQATLLF